MQFKKFLDGLELFFKNNLGNYLQQVKSHYPEIEISISTPNEYVKSEFPDMDKHTSAIVFYITSPEYTFDELSNESKIAELTLDVYVTFSKAKIADLKDQLAVYAEAIVELIKAMPSLAGLVDYSLVTRIKPYEGVEGNASAKALYIELKTSKEI